MLLLKIMNPFIYTDIFFVYAIMLFIFNFIFFHDINEQQNYISDCLYFSSKRGRCLIFLLNGLILNYIILQIIFFSFKYTVAGNCFYILQRCREKKKLRCRV